VFKKVRASAFGTRICFCVGGGAKGYFKDPQATAKSPRDGWLYTGDLGCMDEDGFLFAVGREKALLIALVVIDSGAGLHSGARSRPGGLSCRSKTSLARSELPVQAASRQTAAPILTPPGKGLL
jgi:hypothetical protein